MPVKCQTIISLIEKFAPKSLAEEWDNVGLHIGDPSADINGVIVNLDVNDGVVDEARKRGANLIVSHHPLIFKALKNIRADLPHGRLITDIIKSDINVYCAHTNMDSAVEGVNQVLAELLGLKNTEVLNPDKPEKIYKIVVFIPESHADTVREAMTKAGAGWIGNYSDCTFSVNGTGTFKAAAGCNPFIGEIGVLEKAAEVRLETVVRATQINRVVNAMLKAHPYEEVAYDIYPLANSAGELGLGRVGTLEKPVKLVEFMETVKKALNVEAVRYGGDPQAMVEKVAVCGGSGAGLIHKAVYAGADVFVTGDLKYHEAQEAVALGLSFIDAGHYATENPVVAKLACMIEESLTSEGYSIPVYASRNTCDVFRFY